MNNSYIPQEITNLILFLEEKGYNVVHEIVDGFDTIEINGAYECDLDDGACTFFVSNPDTLLGKLIWSWVEENCAGFDLYS